ncbi:MAG: hypothetical protein IRZ33_05760 [Alicyclobacillaceae bacterium]|nr:hypothetical protein [Alicyclobacillaceae bacterium]
MPIANCARCGRIYTRVRRDICPKCVAEEDRAFTLVRSYLSEHRNADMAELTEATGVDASLVVALIQNGRLILRNNPNLSYPCERCGEPTQSGRFCRRCAKELSLALSAASAQLRTRAARPQRGRQRGSVSR